MIEVRDVVKEFDGFRALDGLNLTVPKSAVYGMVGPNGAGKSTVIRHLTGIYRQDSGTITIDGQPVFENPAVKERIAYIPDDIHYFSNDTIKETMQYYKSIYPKFDVARFNKLGEVFELDQKRQMRRLSKGMQKQAAFWIAVSMHPDIMILDEPVDGLDPVMRRQIWSVIMSDVAENGTTVLVSSHNLRELEDVCDHVGIMNNGKIMIERSLSDLQENIVKLQLALPDGKELPEGMDILHKSSNGRLQSIIVHGKRDELVERISASEPLFVDAVPLTLEEIFIYEMGGVSNELQQALF